jgi:excisionase family DNA binding protein
MNDEVLTIREVADLLKIGDKTAYTMAQAGELPGFKVRGQWRFRRSDLDSWIHDQLDTNAGKGRSGSNGQSGK